MSQHNSAFKSRIMAGTIAISLLLALVWCYARLASARGSATEAGQDLADCRALAARIEALRRLPMVAGAAELGASDRRQH